MKFTLKQLNLLLGKKVCFNTVCELGKQQITGKVIGFTVYQNQECDLVINSDEFGLEDFSGKDIQDLIYS